MKASGDFVASIGYMLSCASALGHIALHNQNLGALRLCAQQVQVWGEPKALWQHERRDDQDIGDPVRLSEPRGTTGCTLPRCKATNIGPGQGDF